MRTPGPWYFGGKSPEGQTVVYSAFDGREEWIAECNNAHHSAKDCADNARAIAALPQLIEAARGALEALRDAACAIGQDVDGYRDDRERLKAALRAAGEEC